MTTDAINSLANARWPVLLVDPTGAIAEMNSAARRLFEALPTAAALSLKDIWHAENAQSVEKFLASLDNNTAPVTNLKVWSKDGLMQTAWVSWCRIEQEQHKYFLLQWMPELPTDATGDSNALVQKQKLDCALQLARSVALDFNNALTSILGHTSFVLSRMEQGNPWRNSLLEVEKAAGAAAEIASDLGAFSRPEKETRGHTSGNLNLLVQRTVEYFRQTPASEPVTWSVILERQPFAAKFDEAKLQQALLKVLENSVQALKGSGRITVQTRNIQLAEKTQDRNVQLHAGAYLCVEINDNGCGILPDALNRVFEPFFTTKGRDHRGLGLAWVYGIMTNHGGGVAISSQPDEGTSVRLYLPAEARMFKESAVAASDLNGSQTILMVDDEDLILTMGQAVLSAYGYRVLTAASGRAGLDLLSAQEKPVDLVITDLVMPGMSGRELVEKIHQQFPAAKVLCTSGYVWPVGQQKEGDYLQKPFTSQDLLLAVKRALLPRAAGN